MGKEWCMKMEMRTRYDIMPFIKYLRHHSYIHVGTLHTLLTSLWLERM